MSTVTSSGGESQSVHDYLNTLSSTRNTNKTDDSQSVIVVGDGIYVDGIYPNSLQFSKLLVDLLQNQLSNNQIAKLIDTVECHTSILQLAYKIFTAQIFKILESEYQPARFNFLHEYLAKTLVNGHLIITTNWDNGVEEAYKCLTGSYPRVISTDQQFELFLNEINKRGKVSWATIIKPHGSIHPTLTDDKKYASIRAFLETLTNSGGLSEPAIKVIETSLKRYQLAMIGYEGRDQATLSPVLLNTISNMRAFCINHDTNIEEEIVDQQTLQDRSEQIFDQIRRGTNIGNIYKARERIFIYDVLLGREFKLWNGNLLTLQIEDQSEDKQQKDKIQRRKQGSIEEISKVEDWRKLLFTWGLHLLVGDVKSSKIYPQKLSEFELGEEEMKLIAEMSIDFAKLLTQNPRDSSNLQLAEELLLKSENTYRSCNFMFGIHECTIELVKIEIMRNKYEEAIKKLDQLESQMSDKASNYQGIRKHLIQVFLQKGIICNMQHGNKKLSKTNRLMKNAVSFASRNEEPLLHSFSLQMMASMLSQSGVRTDLTESINSLERATYLSSVRGNLQLLEEQCTLLGATYCKMADLENNRQMALNFLRRAEKFAMKRQCRINRKWADLSLNIAKLEKQLGLSIENKKELLTAIVYNMTEFPTENFYYQKIEAIEILQQETENQSSSPYLGVILCLIDFFDANEKKFTDMKEEHKSLLQKIIDKTVQNSEINSWSEKLMKYQSKTRKTSEGNK